MELSGNPKELALLRTFSPFDGMKPESLAAFARRITRKQAPKGRVLFVEGDEEKQTFYLVSGSVDLLAEGGGNCELTRAGETVEHGGVRIIGPVNLPATVAYHASDMFARNLLNFIKPAFKDGALAIDWNDEVFAASCVTHEGSTRHEPTRKLVEAA